MKRHHDHSNSYKENLSFRWLNYSFRHHGREHGGMQAGMVQELRVLHLTGNRKSINKLGSILSI